MASFRQETLVGAEAAREALALASAGTGTVQAKPGRNRDVVTDADVAVEDLLRSRLGDALGLPVVGEERGGEAPEATPYWLVDPICGTRNFASGIPLFAVNLALVEDGQITLAIVGDGSSGAVHLAEKGEGAWTLTGDDGHRLSVSPDSAVVDVGIFPPTGPRRGAAAAFLAALVEGDRWDLRTLGTTLSLAYLAAGRLAADVCFAASALHFGAGALLASEAGATVTDLQGAPWGIASTSLLVAATPELHGELLALATRP